MKEILDVIHKTIYQFFDVCGDDEETPMTDKDKLLLKINKAICSNVRALEQEPKADVLDKIRAEIEKVFCISVVTNELRTPMEVKTEILQIIDKYKAESEVQSDTK